MVSSEALRIVTAVLHRQPCTLKAYPHRTSIPCWKASRTHNMLATRLSAHTSSILLSATTINSNQATSRSHKIISLADRPMATVFPQTFPFSDQLGRPARLMATTVVFAYIVITLICHWLPLLRHTLPNNQPRTQFPGWRKQRPNKQALSLTSHTPAVSAGSPGAPRSRMEYIWATSP